MPRLSLTDFIDVVSKSGTSKANKVRQLKNRAEYNPAFDFYKKIRDVITKTHKNNLKKKKLDSCLVGLTDKKKRTAYPQIITSYKKWWGRKKIIWFEPPSDLFSNNGVDISVKPDLGLKINKSPHLIKLYFKSDPLSKNQIDIITHLMAITLSGMAPEGTTMAVLDIRKNKLISPTVQINNLSEMIQAELAYISALWKTL